MILLFSFDLVGVNFKYTNLQHSYTIDGDTYIPSTDVIQFTEDIEWGSELSDSNFTMSMQSDYIKGLVLSGSIQNDPLNIYYVISGVKYLLYKGYFKSFRLTKEGLELTASSNYQKFNFAIPPQNASNATKKINDSWWRANVDPTDYIFSDVSKVDATLNNLTTEKAQLEKAKTDAENEDKSLWWQPKNWFGSWGEQSNYETQISAKGSQITYWQSVQSSKDKNLPKYERGDSSIKMDGYLVDWKFQGTTYAYALYVFSETIDFNKTSIMVDNVAYSLAIADATGYHRFDMTNNSHGLYVNFDLNNNDIFDTQTLSSFFNAKGTGLTYCVIAYLQSEESIIGKTISLHTTTKTSSRLESLNNFVANNLGLSASDYELLAGTSSVDDSHDGVKLNTDSTVITNLGYLLKDAFCVFVYEDGKYKVKQLNPSQTSQATITDDAMLEYPTYGFDYSDRIRKLTAKYVDSSLVDKSFIYTSPLTYLIGEETFELTHLINDSNKIQKLIYTWLNFHNNAKTITLSVNLTNYHTLRMLDVVTVNSNWLSLNQNFYISKRTFNVKDDILTLELKEFDPAYFTNTGTLTTDSESTLLTTFTTVPALQNVTIAEAVEVVTSLAVATMTLSWTHNYDYQATYYINISWTDGVSYNDTYSTKEKTYKFIDYKSSITYTITVYAENQYGFKSPISTLTYYLNGLSYPPADIVNFYANITGEMVYLWWSESADVDVQYGGQFEIRHNRDITQTWDNSAYIGKVQGNVNNFTTPYKFGAYYIKAIDSTGTYSVNANKVTVQDTQLINKNTIVTEMFNFFAPNPSSSSNMTFDSTAGHASMQVATANIDSWVTLIDDITDFDFGDFYGLDLSLSNTGNFVTPIYDLGKILTSRFTIDYNFSSYMSNDTIDGRNDLVDTWGDFDSFSPNNNVQVMFYISTSTDNVTWTDYQLFQVADYTARYFKVKVVTFAISLNINLLMDKLNIIVDVPDIVESATFTSNASGVTKTVPLANTFATNPFVTASINDMDSSNGYFTISNITTTSFDFVVYNINNKSVTYTAKGY